MNGAGRIGRIGLVGCACILAVGVVLLGIDPAAAQTTDPAQTGSAWSPYLAGALIGLLSMFTFYFSNRPLGASSSYAKVGGLIGQKLFPRAMAKLPYFQDNPPKIDWEVMVVLGIIIGAFVAAWSGGELTGRWLQPLWEQRFGDTPWLRGIVAFAGGVLMSFGARLAGGCTSGHGISGALQLSVGSWIALACFFIGGVAVALPFYRL
ncbi:MAG: YeeE/YedE thiosulfate transporter family protein [Alphaproteobacteria bacterium]